MQSFEFKGRAGEWFGIWIVNILLSILTFGIYSAWAKVRTKKYFYQNTFVAGRNFNYHATGMQILIGRLIVIAAFIVYSVLSLIPILGIILPLAFFLVIPILVQRSLRFNARVSSWSNVRFDFVGSIKGAYMVYLVYPILTFLTLFLLAPVADRAAKGYTLGNLKLGAHHLEMTAPLAPFYKAFAIVILWVVGVTAVIWATMMPDFAALDGDDPLAITGAIAAIYLWFFLAILPSNLIYEALVRNVVYNNLSMEGGHRFASNVTPVRLVWIALSNAVATVLSFGLLLPWAHVRMHAYLVQHTHFEPGETLDAFVSAVDQHRTAIADAYTDLDAIDVGLPI